MHRDEVVTFQMPGAIIPGFGRKAVLYATCFVNYNGPDIGMAARAVLARNGVETEVVYPACCGRFHARFAAHGILFTVLAVWPFLEQRRAPALARRVR